MNILPHINPVNFKALCKGQYEELKGISIANGADISKIDKFEKTIQEIFPNNNQILNFNIVGNSGSFNEVTIQLINNEGKVIEQVVGKVIPKNIRCYNHDEVIAEKSKVFRKVVNLVRKLKNKYNTQIQNEQKITEQEINSKSENKIITPVNDICKCVVSHDVDMIKNISISAGYPLKKAEEIYASIKKIFSKDKYNYKVFYLNYGEDDTGNVRRYVIYHGIATANDYYDAKTKTPISTGVTKKDRYNLLERLYNIIKTYY